MLIYAALGYAGWCGLLYVAQDSMLYPGVGLPGQRRAWRHDGMEELRRPLADGGDAVAWFLPAREAAAERPAPLAVYLHGNYETLSDQQWMVELLGSMGFSVLMPEYRGYGLAGGRPSQKAIREDALAFLRQVKGRPEVDGARVFYYGRSLGGGVAADLATAEKPAALVLESTFTSVTAMAWRYLAPPLLVKNPYRSDRVLPGLGVPVQIFHGRRDTTITVAHARRLHALTPGSELWEYECGHNDPPSMSHAADHRERLAAFLKRAGVLR